MRTFIQLVVAVVLLASVVSPAAAQGCSMCYANAAQQEAQAQQALNMGILVLLVPPVLLFAGVMVTAFRRRDEPVPEEEAEA